MAADPAAPRTDQRRALVLTAAIVILALVAGAIHLSLGELIFTLNALGYFALAAAYLVAATVFHPLVVRFSWLPRVALLGYAAMSIVAWLVIGGFYWLGYLTKAIELTLMVLVVLDLRRIYGSATALIRQASDSLRWALTEIRR